MRLSLSRPLATLAIGGLLLQAAGCTGAPPTTAEECAALRSTADRDECYLVVTPLVFKADPKAGITMVETGITDPLTRDMAWYNVTKQVDPHSNKYCDRIQDATLADRCRQVVSRPHLHRELTGKQGGPPPGPGGGPPPDAPKAP